MKRISRTSTKVRIYSGELYINVMYRRKFYIFSTRTLRGKSRYNFIPLSSKYCRCSLIYSFYWPILFYNSRYGFLLTADNAARRHRIEVFKQARSRGNAISSVFLFIFPISFSSIYICTFRTRLTSPHFLSCFLETYTMTSFIASFCSGDKFTTPSQSLLLSSLLFIGLLLFVFSTTVFLRLEKILDHSSTMTIVVFHCAGTSGQSNFPKLYVEIFNSTSKFQYLIFLVVYISVY